MYHDLCYGARGWGSKQCDVEFVDNLTTGIRNGTINGVGAIASFYVSEKKREPSFFGKCITRYKLSIPIYNFSFLHNIFTGRGSVGEMSLAKGLVFYTQKCTSLLIFDAIKIKK